VASVDPPLRERLDRAVADALGIADAEPAAPARGESRKLVVFVPEDALDVVRDALFGAGAGRIGEYERCSWYTAGTGTFLPGEGASPAIGEPGREERAPELRLETVYPAGLETEVVAALVEAHPYEEPAFDLYPRANVEPGLTAGVVGRLTRDPLERLASLGVEPVFRRTAAAGERVAVFTGSPRPVRADVVIAPAGEPDLLAPTLEAWAMERVGE
jgi:hypothetical protein